MGTESTSLRTFVGSVVCIDLVGYSKLPVDRQNVLPGPGPDESVRARTRRAPALGLMNPE